MNYIREEENGQEVFENSTEFLKLPSTLYGFKNTHTEDMTLKNGRIAFRLCGELSRSDTSRKCECGCKMHINTSHTISLKHLNFGGHPTSVQFPHIQFRCKKCGALKNQFIAFKSEDHMLTKPLYQYICDLLNIGTYTLKQVSEQTGVGKNIIKAIDLKRLKDKYTENGEKLRKPDEQARYLSIDEFKLHNGHQYATHIINLENGHILWIGHGKKKQVVYDFIEHVGLDWMKGVEAVACDMNSDFQEAFQEKCGHISIVYDYFHIVKNFNEKVVSEVRKDEQKRLADEGNTEAAKALKKTKYILTASRKTLQKKDKESSENKVIRKESQLFKTPVVTRKGNYETKYDELISENKLLFSVDLIKEKLSQAYKLTDKHSMINAVSEIISICIETGNEHFIRFAKLLNSHFDGIVSHAVFKISSGKIEGINQKIKTIRRSGYGYPDDEYFFLKIMDSSY